MNPLCVVVMSVPGVLHELFPYVDFLFTHDLMRKSTNDVTLRETHTYTAHTHSQSVTKPHT